MRLAALRHRTVNPMRSTCNRHAAAQHGAVNRQRYALRACASGAPACSRHPLAPPATATPRLHQKPLTRSRYALTRMRLRRSRTKPYRRVRGQAASCLRREDLSAPTRAIGAAMRWPPTIGPHPAAVRCVGADVQALAAVSQEPQPRLWARHRSHGLATAPQGQQPPRMAS